MCCNIDGCKKCRCGWSKVYRTVILIGGINWGLVGLGMLFGDMADWNVIHMIFRSMPTLEAIIYLVVGVAAVTSLFGCKCKKCTSGVCPVEGKMENKMESKMDVKMDNKVDTGMPGKM